ncbi:MAG: hypothetical protein CMO81_10630 [Waddliaceae bacterium]|nr:hypothetical protein [Waddliaceae bacterium]
MQGIKHVIGGAAIGLGCSFSPAAYHYGKAEINSSLGNARATLDEKGQAKEWMFGSSATGALFGFLRTFKVQPWGKTVAKHYPALGLGFLTACIGSGAVAYSKGWNSEFLRIVRAQEKELKELNDTMEALIFNI